LVVCFQFRVALRDVNPPIWRSFRVPVTFDFAQLHEAIQTACGWKNSHLYEFVPLHARGPAIVPEAADNECFNWGQVLLVDWFGERGERKRGCGYWYDFGDDWFHDITLEEVVEAAAPELLDGARAFPPEDCGGIPGYEQCVSVLERSLTGDANTAAFSDVDSDRLEWLGDWTPEHFDLAATREEFAQVMRPRPAEEPRFDRATGPRLEQAFEPEAPEEAIKFAQRLGRIVGAGSLAPSRPDGRTALPCWGRIARKKCTGQLFLQRVQHGSGSGIHWSCPGCGKDGIVSGWEGGRFDLSRNERSTGAQQTLRIPRASFEALLDDRTLLLEDERLLCSALPSAGQVALIGTRDELEDLHNATCAAANHAASRAQQKRLDKVIECLDATLQGRPSKRVYSPDVKRATKDLDLLDPELDSLQLFAETARSILMSSLLSKKGFVHFLHQHALGIRGIRRLNVALAIDDPVQLEAVLEGFVEIRSRDSGQAFVDVASTYLASFLRDVAAHFARTRHVETVSALVLRAAVCVVEITMRNGSASGTSHEVRRVRDLVLDLWCANPMPTLAPLGELLLGTVRLKRERTAFAKELSKRREASGDPDGILASLLAQLP